MAKVSQLDSLQLNSDLGTALKENIKLCFSVLNPDLFENYHPEIIVLILYVINSISISKSSATYSQQLLNLKYINVRGSLKTLNRTQKFLHPLLTCILPLIWTRLLQFSTKYSQYPQSNHKYKLYRYISHTEKFIKQLKLLNFLVFLYTPVYSTLVDRLLGMKLVNRRSDIKRMINYDYMNRQLIWTTVTEFMSELLPLLNTRSIKQRIQRLLPKRFIRDQSNAVPEDICLICMRNSKSLDVIEFSECRIVVPWRTQCGHVYCYYCLKSSLMDDSKFMCLRCGETVTEIAEATTEIRDAITPVPVVDE